MKAIALASTFLVVGAAAPAQWEREQLPLAFAQPARGLVLQFARDWRRYAGAGREWAYCITEWSVAFTKDGDSVYLARAARLAGFGTRENHVGDVACVDTAGQPLPVAHVHLTQDCSPSRADIHFALAHMRAPFHLVLCGPGITAGYTPRVFLLAVQGQAAQPGGPR